MSKKNILLGYLFGFITSITLILLVLLLICKFTISNKNYLLNILEKNNYYEKINDEIKEEMELHLLSTGFTNEILENVYTKEEVISDIKIFIDNMYDGKVTILDKSNIRFNLNINIDNFFKKTKLSVMNKTELNNFVDDLTNAYKDEIRLYGFIDDALVKFNKINNIINIGTIITLILFIILSFVLIKIVKIKYYGSIIASGGLIILFIRLFIIEKVDVEELLIITENFSIILRNILINLEKITLISSIILIILGIVIAFINSFEKMKKLKKNYIENM